MKRDMDLIRALLLRLEGLSLRPGAIAIIHFHDPEIAVEGYSTDEIEYHLNLIREAGLVESPGSQPLSPAGITFQSLTWVGHDLLDSIRDPEIWAKAKAGAVKGFTVELLRDLAKGFVRKQIEDRTGVKLG